VIGERYNLRRLSNLPYHLCLAKRPADLKLLTLSNFQFLKAKLSSHSAEEILSDYALALSQFPKDEELHLLRDAFRLFTSTVSSQPHLLPIEIVGRLSGLLSQSPGLSQLVQEALDHGRATSLLMPSLPCFLPPGGILRSTLEGHEAPVTCASFSPDGRYIVSSSKESIRVWEVETASLVHTWEGLSTSSFCFSKTKPLVLFTHGRQLHCFSLETGEVGLDLEGAPLLLMNPACPILISPHETFILAGLGGNPWIGYAAALWEFQTGKLLKVLPGHTEPVRDLAFSPCGRWIVTIAREMVLWDKRTLERLFTFESSNVEVVRVAFQGSHLHMLTRTSKVTVVCPTGEQVGEPIMYPISPDLEVCYSPKSLWRAQTGRETNTICLFDSLMDEPHVLLLQGLIRLKAFGFLPGRRIFVAPERVGEVLIFDSETRKEVFRLKGHSAEVTFAELFTSSAGECLLVTASADSTLRL
jgi:WD40 repeat protein